MSPFFCETPATLIVQVKFILFSVDVNPIVRLEGEADGSAFFNACENAAETFASESASTDVVSLGRVVTF